MASLGLMGGLIPAVALGLLGSALDSETAKQRAAFSAVDDYHRGPDLRGALEEAEQVYFFPLEAISKLKSGGDLVYLWSARIQATFKWWEAKETIPAFRTALKAYAKAVREGQDVLSACRKAIGKSGRP